MLDHDFQPDGIAPYTAASGREGDLVCWAWIFSSDQVPIKMRCNKTWAEHKQSKMAGLIRRVIAVLERDYHDGDSRLLAEELKIAFHTELQREQ